MRHVVTIALALLCAFTGGGCATMQAHIMAHQTTTGLYGLRSLRATVTEHGLLRDQPKEPVVKELLYGRLWKVRAEIKAPKEHAGELFVFDGETLSMWWPCFYFGLRIRGIEVPPKQQIDQAILDACVWAVDTYDYSNEGTTRVRGRAVREWLGEPSEPRPHCYPYRAWIDGEYSIPLRLHVEREPGETWYDMELGPLRFSDALAPDAFAFEFPKDAIVHDWDLRAPGVTLREAQAQVEFPLLVPSRLPAGHRVQKVIVSRNQETAMAALLMNRGASWLSLSELPNWGPILVPKIGIPVRIGGEEGVMNFVLGFTVVSWSVDSTALTLIGNLPYPELLAVAASVRRKPREAE